MSRENICEISEIKSSEGLVVYEGNDMAITVSNLRKIKLHALQIPINCRPGCAMERRIEGLKYNKPKNKKVFKNGFKSTTSVICRDCQSEIEHTVAVKY